MLSYIKRIIRRMNQYARRIWSICFPAFVLLIGFTIQALIFLDGKAYQNLVLISLAILALICLIIALYTFSCDTITTFRKHRLLKILQHLRGYLISMECLQRDFMAESNNRQLEQYVENFNSLHTEIEGYVKRMISDELTVWNKPFSDRQFGIVVKESIMKLKDVISKYELR